MNEDDRQFLKSTYQRLQEGPLKTSEDPLYYNIYDQSGVEDPISLIQTHIEFSEVESMQMFSGFRGSGKTTELFRLKKKLEDKGFKVLYADALNYINPSEEMDITNLLPILAGAFSDALEDQFKIGTKDESYWARFTHFLAKTDINISAIKASIPSGPDLKLALKTTPTFRQNLKEVLASRIGELKRNVDDFITYGVDRIRKKYKGCLNVVFLFDSLEQIQGSANNEEAVFRSLEILFAHHQGMLQLPLVHAVYTVPPWIRFVMPNVARIVMLPSIRQWNNDANRKRDDKGWEALRAILRLRFGKGGSDRYFGDDSKGAQKMADSLIEVCGGHVRDLLYILREAVVRTRALPVTREVLDKAIGSVRKGFRQISLEDARWLAQIEQHQFTALSNSSSENINRLTRFLDTHFVLFFTNGEDWYDIHPLIREEVNRLIRIDKQNAPGDQ